LCTKDIALAQHLHIMVEQVLVLHFDNVSEMVFIAFGLETLYFMVRVKLNILKTT